MEIRIEHLSMTYPSGKQALKDLDLELKAPSLIGLLGPNGAGKSTLMKLLVAALLPTRGEILVDGQPLDRTERLLKARLGYLPQDFGLFDELAVTQFLDYMAALKGIGDPKAAIQKAVRAVNLEEKARAKIRTLSGGQRQRVGIAQAILGDPPFLIFDEPTVGLDPEERIHFRNLFSHAAQDRLVLLSTHIIEEAASVFERVIILDEGKIIENAETDELVNEFRYISGHQEEVDRACQGLEVLTTRETGRHKSCGVRGGAAQLAQAEQFDVDIAPMNLQNVFVALCGHGDEG